MQMMYNNPCGPYPPYDYLNNSFCSSCGRCLKCGQNTIYCVFTSYSSDLLKPKQEKEPPPWIPEEEIKTCFLSVSNVNCSILSKFSVSETNKRESAIKVLPEDI